MSGDDLFYSFFLFVFFNRRAKVLLARLALAFSQNVSRHERFLQGADDGV